MNNPFRSRRSRLTRCSAIAVAILGLWPAVAAAASPPDMVTSWNDIVIGALTPTPRGTIGAGRPNPESAAAAAYMHIAIYDAVSSISGDYTPFATHVAGAPRTASKAAAANEAAYRVLAFLYPAASFPALATEFAAAYATKLAAILPNDQTKADGIAVGLAAANGLLKRRFGDPPTLTGIVGADGFRKPVAYVFLPLAAGVYQKTPGSDGTIGSYAGPVTPGLPQFTPFALLRANQFRADGPPALGSAQWAEDFNEVKNFGAASNLPNLRSAEQEEIGLFYGLINAQLQVARNLRNLAQAQDLTADIGESARFLAQAYTTIADSQTACWESKYYYNFWRPVTAIQHADLDGNSSTVQDGTWMPQIVTPAHPEYPSAHGCVTSAYAHAIAEFFGTKRLPGGITLTGAAGHPNRFFDSTDEIVREIIGARIYNGVHYRTSVVHGSIIGHKTAQWVAKFYFRPVGANIPGGPKR